MKPRLRLVKTEYRDDAAPSAADLSFAWLNRRCWLWLSGWMVLLAVLSPARITDVDVAIRSEVAHALWTRASVFVDKGSPVDSGLVWVTPEEGTSFYGIGQSLAFIPFDILGTAVSSLASDPKIASKLAQAVMAFTYIPLIGTLWFLSLWAFLQSFGVSRRHSLFATIAYFLCTPALFYAAQSAQEEALVATLGLLGYLCAKRAGDSALKDRHALLLCGLFSASCLVVRLNSFFFFLPMLGLFIDTTRKHRVPVKSWLTPLKWVAAGAAAPALVHLCFAYWRFGSFTSLGYDIARAQTLGVFWTELQWDLAFGFLFGLGKGLFVLAPAMVLALFGARQAYRDYPLFGILTAVALLVSSCFHAHILNNPDGSECWSVRYLLHLTVLWVLPAYYGFQSLRGHELKNGLAFSLLAIGAFFAALSLLAPNALEYTQNFAQGKPQKTLLLSWSDGQLARRATNISLWLSGEPFDVEGISPQLQKDIHALAGQYVPNLWPGVLSKKFPHLAVWVWIFWLGAIAVCSRFFWLATRPPASRTPKLKRV